MKYKLTSDSKVINGDTIYQIECETAFSDVNVGDLGGWVQSEANLSQDGNCWVYDNAYISGNANLSENACLYNQSRIIEDGKVSGDAVLKDTSTVCLNGNVSGITTLLKGSCISDNAIIGGDNTLTNFTIGGDAVATQGIHLLDNTFWTCKLDTEPCGWIIVTTDTELSVGCVTNSFEYWDNATDEQISEMHPSALMWWNTAKADVMQFVRDNSDYE